MEYLPESDTYIVKQIVQIVPGGLIWAAVDVKLYELYLRDRYRLQYTRPPKLQSIPRQPVLGKDRPVSERRVDDDRTLPTSPSKARRCISKYKVPVVSAPSVKVLFTDRVFFYRPLGNDFGPLDLPTTHRYINFVDESCDADSVIIHVTDYRRPTQCANSAYLASVYALIRFKMAPREIGSKFAAVPPTIIPAFRDASRASKCSFPITIEHCCEAIAESIRHGWIDWDDFDVETVERLQHVEYGDLNWIVENKFLAFAGPSADCVDEDGLEVHPPSYYAPLFKSLGISDVIRLNVANYDSSEFTSHGMRHHDLFFEDGSCPSAAIVEKFKAVVGAATGAVAVHCKAGLGRTASMIGVAVMEKYNVGAHAFIAWARIARPGSVIGPQQHFLRDMETGRSGSRQGSASVIGKKGEKGQAESLLRQKRKLMSNSQENVALN